MWFAVIFNRDGSIASSEQIAESFASGKRTICVEADTVAAAIALAKTDYKKWAKRKIELLDRENTCIECATRQRKPGVKRCQVCLDRKTLRRDNLRQLKRLTGEELENARALRAQEAVLNRAASQELLSLKGGLALGSIADQRLDEHGLKPQAYTPATLLRYVARAYDRNPAKFRVWLDREITKMTGIFKAKRARKAG